MVKTEKQRSFREDRLKCCRALGWANPCHRWKPHSLLGICNSISIHNREQGNATGSRRGGGGSRTFEISPLFSLLTKNSSPEPMETPGGSDPNTPPVITGAEPVAACAAMAVSYVAVLYVPTVLLRLPPATSLLAFYHRRFVCAAFCSVASVLATVALLRGWGLSDSSSVLAVFGIRSDHLLEAVVIPLLLTSLVYAGSFVARLWVMSSSCGRDDGGVGISCFEKVSRWMQTSLHDVIVWRNCIVAPFTEELVFRACMIPLLLCGGFKMYSIVFLSPVFFSLAHLNHLFELHQQGCNFMRSLLVVGIQLGYTVIFGWYAAFLFIRTGHLVSPIVAHILCNMLGFPVFSSPQTRGVATLAFLAGSISFFCLLFPATSPKLYNTSLDGCSCWHGYCRWS